MIRITGGKYRSRLLLTPGTSLTKPTMDKVREAIFSALSFDKLDNVLDLFSGSGSYGFEVYSRGAKKVTFVDNGSLAISTIKNNAKALEISNAQIVKDDAINFLNTINDKFDVVFVDPPYKLEVYKEVVDTLIKRDLLTSNGIIVLESDKTLDIDFTYFKKSKEYNYGLTKVYILRK